ncbi:MAG: hypothetical protein ACRD0H_25115, partial [Actinomycetes bacterium]
TRGLAIGAGIGLLAALAWFVPVLLWPPVPTSNAWALLAITLAATSATLLTAWRTDRVGQSLLAGLCAGTVAALLIVDLAFGLLRLLPHWVPDIGGHAFIAGISAADRLAANQSYAQDPYIAPYLIGSLLAATLIISLVRAAQPDPARSHSPTS